MKTFYGETMNKSESVKEIAPAFLAAQMKMQPAPKDAKNPHFNSKYSDYESVVTAVRGPLNESDIAFMQPVRVTDAGVEIETVLMHKSGEFYSETLLVPLTRRDAQGVGSAISYGKRYGLQSMCGLPSADDDGNEASAPNGNGAQRRPAPPPRKPDPAPRIKDAEAEPLDETPQALPGSMNDDEKFIAILRDTFESRGFKPDEFSAAVAAVCKKKKITTINKLSGTDRMAFLEAVAAGRFDNYKAAVTA
jgi:hypothetical protein